MHMKLHALLNSHFVKESKLKNVIMSGVSDNNITVLCVQTVSYTHLDVYKRQAQLP